MASQPIDLSVLRLALSQLDEALRFWQAQENASPLKRHLRAAVIQAFEYSYELAVRLLRWRDMRNATSHTYDEDKAQEVAIQMPDFLKAAQHLLSRMERDIASSFD